MNLKKTKLKDCESYLKSSEKEVEVKKPRQILIKKSLYIAFLLMSVVSFGQNNQSKDATWESEKDRLRYDKEKDYKGPDNWYGSSPSDLQEEYIPSNSTGRGS